MKKTLRLLLIGVLLSVYLLRMQSVQASPELIDLASAGPVQVDPVVQASLEGLQPGEMLSVIVTLRQQADLSHLGGVGRAARLQGVIRALQATAEATQAPVRGLLAARQSQGQVQSFESFWVFNGFSVTAARGVIDELARRADVLSITPDRLPLIPASGPPEPNISLIQAPALWNQGFYGQGVVVANMDSGVDVNHSDLAARWRGGSNSWLDPYGQHASPADLSGHGTQTMGIMVGGGAGGTSIGVAPGAQWIAVKIFDDQGGSTAAAIHQGFQWLLDPDGDPNTTDAPQVVNNSWTYANPGCYLDFELDLESLRAAGILPVFAAGNGGPYSNSSYSPANNPAAFAVGAIDNNSQLYAYSSRGPTTCGGSTGPFPEIVAPGVNILTTDLYGMYTAGTGTSLAAPHAAGGLALLLSAYPDLDAGMQEQALIQSAVDLGAAGPDDLYGYGQLNLLSALNWAGTAPTSTPPPAASPSPTPTLPPTPFLNPNLALNQPVITSSYQDSSHTGFMAVDGDPATQWQTAKVKGRNRSVEEWLEVDLGSLQAVSQVVLDWGTYFATDYTIQASGDGSAWSTVSTVSNENGGRDTASFSSVQTRFIRLNTTAWNDSAYRNWLNELEVYAESSPSSATSTPIATATPTATAAVTLAPSATVAPSATPTASTGSSVHVGDLDSASTRTGNRWEAVVTVRVHDALENPLQGVLVSGIWGNGASGAGSCTTGVEGACTISINQLPNNLKSISFTVTGLAFEWLYQPALNHDPDGDSDGTSITIFS